MLEYFTSTQAVLIYSVLLAVSMKVADLLDEHGLKIFYGDGLLFGILWGVFGALIIISNQVLAVFYISLLIHWILRYRIDYLNHGVAAAIMLVSFLVILPDFSMDWLLFSVVFVIFSIHGLMNDAADKKKRKNLLFRYAELNSHYLTIPLILFIINPAYWIVFTASMLHVISYEATKKIGRRYCKNP